MAPPHDHHNHAHHCGDEATADDHHHHHGHDHDHDHDLPDRGAEYSLYQKVDLDKVRCLNEAVDGSAKKLFKPWDERLDDSKFVESEADEQLILHIPFTGQVKLKAIALRCMPDSSAPAEMKAFINKEDLDFDNADGTTATQEWELIAPADFASLPDGIVEYQTRITKFGAVRSLTLYFPRNFGEDVSRLYYVGLRGEFSELARDPVITLYEAAPNPSDHTPITGISEFTSPNAPSSF